MQATCLSYHKDLLNIAMLKDMKDLCAQAVDTGGELYLRPDGNSS